MKDKLDSLGTDGLFFTSLVEAGLEALDRLLSDDFILIDVMSGSEITKSSLLSAINSGQLRFEAIEPIDSRERLYHTTAVITGRTKMSGWFGELPFVFHSRYTHVYVRRHGQWHMVAAQGTPISHIEDFA